MTDKQTKQNPSEESDISEDAAKKEVADEIQTNICPKCGASLSDEETTTTGKRLRRCSKGSWDPETKQVQGCPYVLWVKDEPKKLDEKCPKCDAQILVITTRSGKLLKKCSKSQWDPKERTELGCDYHDWYKGGTKELDEKCPECGEKVLLITTSRDKKLKTCSKSQWDPKERKRTGCQYVEWQND